MAEPNPEFPSTAEISTLMNLLSGNPSKARKDTARVIARALLSGDTAGLAHLSIALESSAKTVNVNGWVEARTFKDIVDSTLEILDAQAAQQVAPDHSDS